MRKARDLVGLPIVDTDQGEHVGEVRDVLFTPKGTMFALLVEKSGLLAAAKVLKRERIRSVGQDAILISARSLIEEWRDETGLIRSLIEGDVHFAGKDVLTQGGNLFGTVEDVYLDDELRTIVGYEISEGFIADIKEGRKVLPAHPGIMVGADSLLVPEEIELTDSI
ncbi:MAG: PRC-barrel domain-containing protein [Tumebacillaceae bacterium]